MVHRPTSVSGESVGSLPQRRLVYRESCVSENLPSEHRSHYQEPSTVNLASGHGKVLHRSS